MTAQAFTNNATGHAGVALQAGSIESSVVHIDYHYAVPPDATPEQKFRAGVEYLQARMPDVARRYIEEAAALGYRTDEVHFHRLLALLSGRSLRQLSSAEYQRLGAVVTAISKPVGDGEWTVGLRSLLTLLSRLHDADPELFEQELDGLPPRQRDLIVDHLGALLEGPMQDHMWFRSVERAGRLRLAHDRTDRVWIFFQPRPAPPQHRWVTPRRIRFGDIAAVVAGATAFLYAVGTLGRLLLENPAPIPLLAYLVALAGCVLFLRFGSGWYSRRHRIRHKDAQFAATDRRNSPDASDGFARAVDRMFDKYFSRYVPRGAERAEWVRQTRGIRASLRDELVHTYRAQRIKPDQIAWLVRHLVGDVRQRWERGTLTDYRRVLRTPLRVRLTALGGLVAIVTGSLWTVPRAVSVAPLPAVLCTLLAVPAGLLLTRGVFSIECERRRVVADIEERDAQFVTRRLAFERWTAKLARRPSDTEMAEWLESDRKVLINVALRHYRLRMSQVIAHAFIEAPAKPYQRARVLRAPWRYSQYHLLLFLLTHDGVRQVDFQLDFVDGTFQRSQRLNFRFDAVAAVRVLGSPTRQQTFQLTLVNGEPIEVPVTEDVAEDIQPDENPRALSDIALDASGLPRTLNVLEGIAAEGKEWIRHQRQRAADRLPGIGDDIRDRLI